MSSNTSQLSTYNYLVPASGTTHAVFQQCDFPVAGSATEDWRAFSTHNFQFRPQGAYIDNTGGTATATLSIQGAPFKAAMPAGYAGWVSFPSTANLVTIISGTGAVNITYVDFPVFNSAPIDSSGNPASGNVIVSNTLISPANAQLIVAGNPVSATNALPVISTSGTLTDLSGTITTANTSQQIQAAVASRKYILIQNNSSGTLGINFTSAATLGEGSIQLTAGASFFMENNFISNEAINIIGATAGQAFTAKVA